MTHEESKTFKFTDLGLVRMLKPWLSFMSFVSKFSVFMLYQWSLNVILWRTCWNTCAWEMIWMWCYNSSDLYVDQLSSRVPAMQEIMKWLRIWVSEPNVLFHSLAISFVIFITVILFWCCCPLICKMRINYSTKLQGFVGSKLMHVQG